MESKSKLKILALLLCALFATTSCAPITEDSNNNTGNPVALIGGAAAGAGTTAAFNASVPVIAGAGVAGAGLGYYLSTLRFASGGIIKLGGQVYTIGDYVIIDLPTDNMFDTNTTEFLPGADLALDGAVAVLKRYPHHNIIISGNTSGYGSTVYQKHISQERAGMVASYLWAHGITDSGVKPFQDTSANGGRDLIYVGYGNNYPIANDLRIHSIRSNSRIQIVAFPKDEVLHWNTLSRSRFKPFKNVGSVNEAPPPAPPAAFIPAPKNPYPAPPVLAETVIEPPVNEQVESPALPPSQNTGLSESLNEEFSDGLQAPPATSRNIVSATPTYNNNNEFNEPQTLLGSNTKKHWGFKGDNELHDETPTSEPLERG
jgi:hypothetical protein